MAEKIFLADGLSKVDEEALKYCLSCEGDVYYHALAGGKRLLFDLLSINNKCSVTEVAENEVDSLLQDNDFKEVRLFQKKYGWKFALGLTAGLVVLIYGIVLGRKLSK